MIESIFETCDFSRPTFPIRIKGRLQICSKLRVCYGDQNSEECPPFWHGPRLRIEWWNVYNHFEYDSTWTPEVNAWEFMHTLEKEEWWKLMRDEIGLIDLDSLLLDCREKRELTADLTAKNVNN